MTSQQIQLPTTPSFRLDGKRALVAGASSGIGLGCAIALAEAGAHVIMAARGQKRLDIATIAAKAAGYSVEPLTLDVSDTDAVASSLEKLGPLDCVINSAGLARHSPALETKPEDFDAVSDANVKGAYFLAVAAAKGMVSAGNGGSIITISSQMGFVGGVDRAVYCATKHAVEGFTKAMAMEFGPHNIRVNTICPTFIKTPLTEPTFADPERVSWIKKKIKLDRIGEVEDIMGAAVFLSSDAAAMITGTHLLIDGGWTTG